MKKLLTSFFIVLCAGSLSAQTVENIQVEQDGEKLNIMYRIGGSTSAQLYDVTLTCSIDGEPVFEPKSVVGDVGANIRGGKSYNTIVWNVFNDVDEVGELEFFVKVDLVKDESPSEVKREPATQPKANKGLLDPSEYRKIHVAYSAATAMYAGIKLGYLDNWGVYASFRYGGYNFYYYDNVLTEGTLMSANAGITKRILVRDQTRYYAYVGGGAGDLDFGYAEFDFGATCVIKNRYTVSLGWSTGWPDLTFGAGFVF